MRTQLILWIPGGVLKSGSPGSDGEPGCGFSWALGGHPGGAARLPGAAWRAGQKAFVLFFPTAVHTLKKFHAHASNLPTPPVPTGGVA